MKNKLIIFIALLCALPFFMNAQKVLLDAPVKAGDLTLFQDVSDENAYYYLADQVRLGVHEDGTPQFSFLRYVQNVRAEEETREGIGGGIVHALMELHVSDAQRQEAQKALRKINSSGVLKGAILFESGTVALISSFKDDKGEFTKQVVGLGAAPVLDGQKVAISVQLTRLGSQILWESFQTPTPDFSISFQMEIKGYRSPKRVLVEADFEQIYKHTAFEAAAVTPVFASEINTAFDDLRRTGAIKMTQIGEDAKLEAAGQAAYAKLTKMMFDPIGSQGIPGLKQQMSGGKKSMLDRATEMLTKARKETQASNKDIRAAREKEINKMIAAAEAGKLSSYYNNEEVRKAREKKKPVVKPEKPKPISEEKAQKIENKVLAEDLKKKLDDLPEEKELPSFASTMSFRMKQARVSGKFTIDLNKFTAGSLSMRFDENIGQIDCEPCFKVVNLDDVVYQQREVLATLDGMNSKDFQDYINFVNVLMRKTHESGEITNDEVKIDRSLFNKEGNNFKMLYGWKGDNDRTSWDEYEYKTIWNFYGGHSETEDWQKTEAGLIGLSPPFVKQSITLEMDQKVASSKNLRSVEVIIYSTIGAEKQAKRFRLNFSNDEYSKEVEIIQPANQVNYEFELIGHVRGGEPINLKGLSSQSTYLYVDNYLK